MSPEGLRPRSPLLFGGRFLIPSIDSIRFRFQLADEGRAAEEQAKEDVRNVLIGASWWPAGRQTLNRQLLF